MVMTVLDGFRLRVPGLGLALQVPFIFSWYPVYPSPTSQQIVRHQPLALPVRSDATEQFSLLLIDGMGLYYPISDYRNQFAIHY